VLVYQQTRLCLFFVATSFCCALLPMSVAGSISHATAAEVQCKSADLFQSSSLPQAEHSISCDVRNRKLLMIGDYHGSNEIPDFVGNLVKQTSAGRPVRLGLELDAFEQKTIDAYVHSAGTAADRSALLHDGYWSNGQGRTSQAIVRLIETVRALKSEGHDVGVFTMVPEYPGDSVIAKAGGDTAYWNFGIVQSIKAQLKNASPESLIIAFMGNEHFQFVSLDRGNQATVSEQLISDKPYLVNLRVHGQAWNCSDNGCGVHEVGLSAYTSKYPIASSSVIKNTEAVQAWISMPILTASPPAREKNK
jgi:hypothetical protein